MKKVDNNKFDLLINFKTGVANAAGAVLFAYFCGITLPWVLVITGIFGFCGGSLNDLASFRRNNKG